MDTRDQVLRGKIARLVKVLWQLITTQIVLSHTLNTISFEHFLRSNQPN